MRVIVLVYRLIDEQWVKHRYPMARAPLEGEIVVLPRVHESEQGDHEDRIFYRVRIAHLLAGNEGYDGHVEVYVEPAPAEEIRVTHFLNDKPVAD